MTTRLKGFTVALEQDLREDDAERIRQAILALRHVLNVQPIEADADDWINRQRITNEIREKLFNILRSNP